MQHYFDEFANSFLNYEPIKSSKKQVKFYLRSISTLSTINWFVCRTLYTFMKFKIYFHC